MGHEQISSLQARFEELGYTATQSTVLGHPTLDPQLTNEGAPFIPGLPDDVALQCILRVPVNKHASCKTVCKRWHMLFGSQGRFFSTRKEFGFQDPWLIVPVFDESMDKIKWKVLDLTHLSWHTMPSVPCNDKMRPYGSCCVSIPREGVLFVCGGFDIHTYSVSSLVFKYEISRDQWTMMENMITERIHYASGVIDGLIYVAGGVRAKSYKLNSAEVFDPQTGLWRPISNMLVNMAVSDSRVLGAKLYVKSIPFQSGHVSRGQVYDPVMNTWENMALGLQKGWKGRSIVVYAHLFVVTNHGSTKLEVYNMETDSWDVVEGTPMPEISQVHSVSCWEGQIYVVCKNLHVAVGYMTRRIQNESSGKTRCRFSVQWKMVDAPEGFSEVNTLDTQVLLA